MNQDPDVSRRNSHRNKIPSINKESASIVIQHIRLGSVPQMEPNVAYVINTSVSRQFTCLRGNHRDNHSTTQSSNDRTQNNVNHTTKVDKSNPNSNMASVINCTKWTMKTTTTIQVSFSFKIWTLSKKP